MRSSWTDSGPRVRLLMLAAVVVGGLVGGVMGLAAPVGSTAALLTAQGTVMGEVGVRACSATPRPAAVQALDPVLLWDFAQVRSGDVAAPGLPVCDDTGAWDLAGTVDGGRSSGGVAVADPRTWTVALLVDRTGDGPGDLLSVEAGEEPAVVLVVEGDGGLRAEVHTAAGPRTLRSGPLPAAETAHLVAVVSGPSGVRLVIDGTVTDETGPLAGRARRWDPAPPVPDDVTVRVGAAPGSGQRSARAVVDEVMVVDRALGDDALRGLVDADRW